MRITRFRALLEEELQFRFPLYRFHFPLIRTGLPHKSCSEVVSMKRIGMCVCAAFCCAVMGSLAMAQESPWNGSWKADPATLKYEGPTFSVATDADGFTVTMGGVAEPKTVCDAGPNKRPDGVMASCRTTDDGYQVNSSKDGKPITHVTLSVSGDDKMLTRRTLVFPPEDGTYTITTRAERVSGGPGMKGTWKVVGFAESQDTGVLTIKVEGDSVAFKETDTDKPIECKLDGTPVKTRTLTIAIKPEGPRTLKVTYAGEDGKMRRENRFVLSEDGTTVTETDVTPEPTASTMTLTLHKM